MAHIIGWIFIGGAAIFVSALYWRAVAERNHLTCYVGMVLLDDPLRTAHKQSLENFLRDSTASDASALSATALLAIQKMAERLAVADPKAPLASSVFGFHGLVWNRKKALEGRTDER